MKLWDKGYTTANIVDKFTVGDDRVLDLKLAKYDVAGSKAHAEMLGSIGILSNDESKALIRELAQIEETIEEGTFIIEEEFEDVHSKIEYILVEKLGETGKKIHTGRSRNDQVLVDLHLYVKAEIDTIKKLVKQLFDQWLKLAKQHEHVIMPGYTHTQIAMPSSFGLWFSAYAESLIDDILMLNAVNSIADQNPLGSAAGYGSSFPINRQMTTEILGFNTLKYNSIAAQMMRGKLEKTVAFALSSMAGTLSKFASDICLFMSQNFCFISFPKELTTGSSIMPQKHNPDVFELMRARCNHLQNLPTEINSITNNLTTGYHRDFQELKSKLIFGISTIKDNLSVCHFTMQHIMVNKKIMDDEIYDHIYAVEDVNKLVSEGMSFRDAYKKIGEQIESGNYKPSKELQHTHEGSIGNLCLDDIQNKMEQLL